MRGSAGALLALLTLATPAAGGDLVARSFGHAGIELTDGERTIVVDFPYTPGAYGAPEWDPLGTRVRPGALCLFTHSHADHFDAGFLETAECAVAGPADVLSAVAKERRRPVDGALAWEGIGIVPVPSDHAGLEHLSYRIDWDGFTLYVTGDTDSATELLAQRGIDVAFVTPWLLSNPRTVRRLDARRIVVVHHDGKTTAPGCEHCFVPSVGQVLRLRAGR